MIRFVSTSEVEEFVQCYIQVFRTLYGTLPEGYVSQQISKASTPDFNEKVLGLLDSDDNILLLSSESDQVTGMAWANVKDDAVWLSFMGVKKRYRGTGLGRSLLNRVILESKSRGAQKISLNTDPSLVPAISLYESEGFLRDGTAKNPYGLELKIFSKALE